RASGSLRALRRVRRHAVALHHGDRHGPGNLPASVRREPRPRRRVRVMNVLGIETSCDETSVAVLDGDGRVLSNIVASQAAAHAAYGGVVPELAARAHLENLPTVFETALEEAGIEFADLGLVCATAGPGLIGALLVGLSAGKALAFARGLPAIGVNHLEGHL